MILSTEEFLVVVTTAGFLIICTTGLIYTIWCANCCRVPKVDNKKSVERSNSIKQGNGFYTEPSLDSGCHGLDENFGVSQVLSHHQLMSHYYYIGRGDEAGKGNDNPNPCDLNHLHNHGQQDLTHCQDSGCSLNGGGGGFPDGGGGHHGGQGHGGGGGSESDHHHHHHVDTMHPSGSDAFGDVGMF